MSTIYVLILCVVVFAIGFAAGGYVGVQAGINYSIKLIDKTFGLRAEI